MASVDEDRTLARLRKLRADLIDPTVADQNGRVFKRTGDGALIEFRSVVEAVRCAITIQNAMVERNVGVPADQRIDFRIGIHLGDVVEESDGDLMGDGVNIAARLEGIAAPGSICLSEDAYRQVRARLDLVVSDLGQTNLKNIAEPVRVYSLNAGLPAQAKPSVPIEPKPEGKTQARLPPVAEDLRSALSGAVSKSLEESRKSGVPFSNEAFYQEFQRVWLITTEHKYVFDPTAASGSFFFLFWKNLSVTNIILSELASLIRLNTSNRTTNSRERVDFICTEDYKSFLNDVWTSLFSPLDPDPNDLDESSTGFSDATAVSELDLPRKLQVAIESLLRFHQQFFEHTIIFDTYFTSALIHIPLSLSVDIRSITLSSGYIHSSGAALYFRNIDKASQAVLTERLSKFLAGHAPRKFFITPFASEFFSPFDAKSSASMRNGIDGVKLQLRKHYFEKELLLIFLTRLIKRFPDQLMMPSGVEDYTDERIESVRDYGADPDTTIFFVTDFGILFEHQSQVINRSKDLYIIAYAQRYLNNNQLTIFKERKPGWIASTTLPHTLSAAMINIARLYAHAGAADLPPRGNGSPVILDPFCGTGTVLLDAAVRIDKAKVIGFDRSVMTPMLVRDNLSFLALSPMELAQQVSWLTSIVVFLGRDGSSCQLIERIRRISSDLFPATPEDQLAFCVRLLLVEMGQNVKFDLSVISDASVSKLSNVGFSTGLRKKFWTESIPLFGRELFYVLWRSLLMNTFSVRREARRPDAIVRIFAEEISRSLKEFSDFESASRRDLLDEPGSHNEFCERRGTYSREGSIRPGIFAELSSRFNRGLAAGDHGGNKHPSDIGSKFLSALGEGIHVFNVQDFDPKL